MQVLGSVTIPATATSPAKKYTNVLTLNTAGCNLLLFACPSTQALLSWTAALRLAAWEKSRLEEIYTAHLFRITLQDGTSATVGVTDLLTVAFQAGMRPPPSFMAASRVGYRSALQVSRTGGDCGWSFPQEGMFRTKAQYPLQNIVPVPRLCNARSVSPHCFLATTVPLVWRRQSNL